VFFNGTDGALAPVPYPSGAESEMKTERMTLPVLPLREVVLFPGVTTPIGAGRPATLRAIEAALKNDARLIFAVSQTENVDRVTPNVLYTMGTVARITQVQRGLAGVQIVLHGEARGTAIQYNESGDYLQAVVKEVPELPPLKSMTRRLWPCTARPGSGRRNWGRSPACRKRW
jgi:ATP-dependent Lon protease